MNSPGECAGLNITNILVALEYSANRYLPVSTNRLSVLAIQHISGCLAITETVSSWSDRRRAVLRPRDVD